MKKQFYRRTSAGVFRTFRPLPVILGGVIVVLIFLRFVFPTAFFFIVSPVWKIGDAATYGVDQFFSGLTTKNTLIAQLDAAQKERDALLQENKTLEARVTDIQKVVGGAEGKNVSVVAGVIARPPVSPYETLAITLEENSPVTEHSLVVGPGGVPLGTIVSINGKLAQVKLFSEKGRETEGWVGESRIPATLVGSGTGSFETFLPGNTEMKVGDAVYLPGPGALFVGNIVKVETEQSTQKLHVLIRSVVNPFSISWVGIVQQQISL